ncbi:MAG: hypothetical protein K8S25_15355 [Alphaproteobacteria bacterium]|nr:hypothetical protein [Alphaproteobacteria bacterium]
MGWNIWSGALVAAGLGLISSAVRAEELRPTEPAPGNATVFEASSRVRAGWTEIAFRGDRPKAWDETMSPEFRASLRVLYGLFEGKLEIGATADRFTAFDFSNSDALRGEVALGLNTGAWSFLGEWKTRDVFVPGFDDFLVGLNTYDLRIKNRFTANLFDSLQPGLCQASFAGGYVASTPHLFARYFAELEFEYVQRFTDGLALTLAPKLELSEYLDFPGGDREDAVFSFRVIPAYSFGGGVTISVEGQANVAISTLESKTGDTWSVTPIFRFQKSL